MLQQLVSHLALLTKPENHRMKNNLAIHFQSLLENIPSPTTKITSEESIHYFAYLLHAQRLLDSLLFLYTFRERDNLHNFLLKLRHKIRHDSRQLPWQAFYAEFDPFIKMLHTLFAFLPQEDISKDSSSLFYSLAIQKTDPNIIKELKARWITMGSNIEPNIDKRDLYVHTLYDLITHMHSETSELRKAAALWLIADIAEAGESSLQYRLIYRALGHEGFDQNFMDFTMQQLQIFVQEASNRRKSHL